MPYKDMKLVKAVKGLVTTFWHDNTRPYSNTNYVVKCCRGSMNNELHVKHYLNMTQTQLFEMFKISHAELRLEKRYFVKCNPMDLENISYKKVQKSKFVVPKSLEAFTHK